MKLLEQTETIIKTNDKFELVQIDKVYTSFKTKRIEIRGKYTDYSRGFSGTSLESVIEIFDNKY